MIFAPVLGTVQSAPFGAVSGEAWGPAACHALGRHVGTGKPHNNCEPVEVRRKRHPARGTTGAPLAMHSALEIDAPHGDLVFGEMR